MGPKREMKERFMERDRRSHKQGRGQRTKFSRVQVSCRKLLKKLLLFLLNCSLLFIIIPEFSTQLGDQPERL